MRTRNAAILALVLFTAATAAGARFGAADGSQEVGEKRLLDNERVAVYEFTFPPGFKGEAHAAVADEFAYVLDGEFGVLTKGQGKRIVKKGEIEYASKGTVHGEPCDW
ncbi:MAG: cupin domain-containing protein [Candidatus Rokubacteria bacterium]|nr:cupin domain-containing protein [Candidatus Rokubacteria bacterium]